MLCRYRLAQRNSDPLPALVLHDDPWPHSDLMLTLPSHRRQVEREINIHINIKHENVIGLFGAFEDDNNVYLVQELALGGDLYQKCNDGTRFNEQKTVQGVILPFMQALKYLHSQVSGKGSPTRCDC